MAEGHGLHVKEADVHLGLDVDALPDLKRTERREGLTLTQASPEPSPLPLASAMCPWDSQLSHHMDYHSELVSLALAFVFSEMSPQVVTESGTHTPILHRLRL